MTDQEIYDGIAKKDNTTFSYLYSEYKNMIFSMVKKNSGSDNDAHDVFQDGLVAMWVNISTNKYQLKTDVKLSSYLYTLCRNIWISKLRKRKPIQEILVKDELLLTDNPNDSNEYNERIASLMQHVKKLGENCRNLLRLFYYDKATMKQIALKLNITEKSAKNSKYRCMENLRSMYQEKH